MQMYDLHIHVYCTFFRIHSYEEMMTTYHLGSFDLNKLVTNYETAIQFQSVIPTYTKKQQVLLRLQLTFSNELSSPCSFIGIFTTAVELNSSSPRRRMCDNCNTIFYLCHHYHNARTHPSMYR